MYRKRLLTILLAVLLTAQLVLPCLAREDTQPSVTITVRALTEEELPEGAPSGSPLYGLFVRSGGTSYAISDLKICLSLEGRILPTNPNNGTTVTTEDFINCLQVLGISYESSGVTKPYRLRCRAAASSTASETVVCIGCEKWTAANVQREQDLFVMYFQIQDGDLSSLTESSIRLETDSALQQSVGATAAVLLQDHQNNIYGYGSQSTDLKPLTDEDVSLVIDVPKADTLQSASITVPSELTVPTQSQGQAELPLSVTAYGQNGVYTGSYETVWRILNDGGTGASIDEKTGVLSIGPTGSAGTVQVQAQLTADSGTVTADANVTVSRATPVPTSLTLLRDGEVLGAADTVLAPAGAEDARTYSYSATVYDQYGAVLPDAAVSWTAADNSDPDHLTVSGSTLTVLPGAVQGASIALTASAGGISKSVTVSVANLQPDWSEVEQLLSSASLTYGQRISEKVSLPATGTASAAGVTLHGTFSYADGDALLPAGNASVPVEFTVTDAGDYAGLTFRKTFSLAVAPKSITVQAEDQTAYYGALLPKLTFSVSENTLEGSDTAEDLQVSLSTTATSASLPGTYPITGTAAAANYHVTVLQGTLTVKEDTVASVTCSDGTPFPSARTLYAQDIREAKQFQDLNLPQKITIKGAHGAQKTVDAKWNLTLQELQDLADTAAENNPAKVTLTLAPETYPSWAAVPSELPSVALTIQDKRTIPDGDLTFPSITSTYGTSYTPAASVADKPEYAGMTFTYTWNGQKELPKNAGTYQLTVTASNAGYRGTATAQLTIQRKALTRDMVDVDLGPFVYTGSAIQPTCTIADIINNQNWITTNDYTILYENNINACDSQAEDAPLLAVIATKTGNYIGTIILPFTIKPASLADKTPVLAGGQAVGSTLTVTLDGVVSGSYTWQWFRDGKLIPDATDATYVLTSADSGRSITVQATTNSENYVGTTVSSAAVSVEKQAITGTVTLSEAVNVSGGTEGVLEPGDTLQASTQLTPAVGVVYQWYLDGEAVADATSETFRIPSGSAGKAITVSVKPADSHFTGSVTSSAVTVGRTTLHGDVVLTRTGDTVTAALSGNLSDATCTVVWLRNGQVLPQASGLTYTLTEADLGTTLSAKAVAQGDYTGEIVSTELAIPATVPAAPTVTVSAGDKKVTVSWTAGSSGGAPITKYRLTVTGGGQTVLTRDLDALTTSYTVTELVNGTSYTFAVSAINSVGASKEGTASATPKGNEGGGGGGGIVVPPDVPEEPEIKFDDVADDRWSAPYIYDLCGRGIAEGVGNGRFAPDRAITRAEFVKLLSGVAGVDLSTYTADTVFEDVAQDAWYAPYVAWAAETGVTNGTAPDRFSPNDTITREQMAAMVYRFADSAGLTLPAVEKPEDFTDSGEFSPWAVEAIAALQRSGLLNGVGDGRFAPDGLATREQACKMLSLLLELLEA